MRTIIIRWCHSAAAALGQQLPVVGRRLRPLRRLRRRRRRGSARPPRRRPRRSRALTSTATSESPRSLNIRLYSTDLAGLVGAINGPLKFKRLVTQDIPNLRMTSDC